MVTKELNDAEQLKLAYEAELEKREEKIDDLIEKNSKLRDLALDTHGEGIVQRLRNSDELEKKVSLLEKELVKQHKTLVGRYRIFVSDRDHDHFSHSSQMQTNTIGACVVGVQQKD